MLLHYVKDILFKNEGFTANNQVTGQLLAMQPPKLKVAVSE
jgi:hypothetical protein